MTMRETLCIILLFGFIMTSRGLEQAAADEGANVVTKYVRFKMDDAVAYGIVEQDRAAGVGSEYVYIVGLTERCVAADHHSQTSHGER